MQATTGAFFAEPGEAVQRVEGIGFRPDTVVLWWSGQSVVGRERGCRGGVGFAAGGSAVATGWYAEDGVPRTKAGSATGDAAVVVPAAARPALQAKPAFSRGGFSLSWDSPPDDRLLIHYLCLGGVPNGVAGRVEAEPSRIQNRVPIGFVPDLVLVTSATGGPGLLAAVGAAGGGVSATSSFVYPNDAPPYSAAGLQREGAILGVPRPDRTLGIPRSDRTDAAALLRVQPSGEALEMEWEGTATDVLYLALGGVRCRVGMDESPVAPRARRTRLGFRRTRLGFRPHALLAFTWGMGASNVPRHVARLCIGAAVGRRSVSTAWFVRNVPAAAMTVPGVVASHEHLLLVPDTKRDRLHSSARLEAFHPDGFSLQWPESDSVLRRFAYVALADRTVRVRRLLPFAIAFARRMRRAVRRTAARGRRRKAAPDR